jgi:hypothetical protein
MSTGRESREEWDEALQSSFLAGDFAAWTDLMLRYPREYAAEGLAEAVKVAGKLRAGLEADPELQEALRMLRPDHEPGPDCPNVPHTCLICQPKVEARLAHDQDMP